jgi:hypothetical protein
MTRISSKSTFFYKDIFPVLWFGFLAIFIVTTLLGGAVEKDFMFLVVPCSMAVLGFFLFRKLVWNLADEVYDGGDFLVVRFRSEEEHVALSNIMNVSASTNMNPPRITLRLVQPGKFGSEFAFSPTKSFTLNPFAKSEVAEDLMVRVDKARSRRVA